MDVKYKSVIPRFRCLPQWFYLNTALQALLLVIGASIILLYGAGAQAAEFETADPLEPVNRVMLRMNRAVDSVLFKPAARTYQFVTPGFVKSGVRNFFGNLEDLSSAVNDVLQLRFDRAAVDLGRFVVNSTVGIAGVFDVAEPMLGLQPQSQDFGMTLAAWGVESGPYVVLPLLGPSTVRDAFAIGFNSAVNPVMTSDESSMRDPVLATQTVDKRAGYLPFEEMIFGDEYLFIREMYLQNRHYKTHGEAVDLAFENF